MQDDETAFVVVASPDRDALREAAFFVERLATERMPLAGVVVNRVQMVAGALSRGRAEDAADALDAGSAASSASADLLRLHADLATSADRHQGAIARFRTANPGVALTQVPTAARDIHDVEGLRTVGAHLAG